MGAFETILILTLIGFLLLAAEAFVPGLVLGLLGAACLLGAVGVSYGNFGLLTGTLTLAGVAALTLVGFVGWMQVFPHTAVGRRIMLPKTLPSGESATAVSLLGQEGHALTPLRPSGTAVFQGGKVDVSSENDFIDAGSSVLVVREEGRRVFVRKKE